MGGWRAGLSLAEEILESSLRPPRLKKSQLLVFEYVNTSSGRTGMELTREMDGRKGVIFLTEFSTLIPLIPMTFPIALQTYMEDFEKITA